MRRKQNFALETLSFFFFLLLLYSPKLWSPCKYSIRGMILLLTSLISRDHKLQQEIINYNYKCGFYLTGPFVLVEQNINSK